MKKLICIICVLITLSSVISMSSCTGTTRSGVMIYEVYTSGGYSSGENYAPYQYCYVVLYNSNDTAVDLTGWSIRFCKNNTTKSISDMNAVLEGSIAAKGFYVMRGGTAAEAYIPYVGEALGFNIDAREGKFKPDRKSGIIALCNGDAGKETTLKNTSKFVEDYLAYCDTEKEETKLFEGKGPALGASVKKILRRVAFQDTNDNQSDFETKDIIDKPANIIHYTKDLKSADVPGLLPPQKAYEVTFSKESGYFENEFMLSITTDMNDNPKIYYTTDGSAPITPAGTISPNAVLYDDSKKIRIFDKTGENTNLMDATGLQPPDYSDTRTAWPPLKNEGESDAAYNSRMTAFYKTVYKANVIRACAINDKKSITVTKSNTYFVSKKNLTSRYNLPIVSIFIDKKELFDYKTGLFIYENIENRDDTAKRPAMLQYFEKDGKLAFAENFAFSLNGGYSRVFPQKSIRVNMSNELFNYDLFKGRAKNSQGQTMTYFDRFILRGGGSDWQSGLVRDTFWQSFCSSLGTFDTQASQPCVAFLNGEFWGIYNMIERQDEYYVSTRYNIPKEDVTIVEGFFALQHGISPDEVELQQLREYVINEDMTKPENYQKFTDKIDIDSFIDYFACELYSTNNDWPHNNLKMWKNRNKNSKENQKWRMMMQDVDLGFTSAMGPESDPIEWITTKSDNDTSKMFTALLNNAEFKKKFLDRFEYLLDNFFIKENMHKELDRIKADRSAAIDEHISRFLMNLSDRNEGTYNYIKDFVTKRNAAVKASIKKARG